MQFKITMVKSPNIDDTERAHRLAQAFEPFEAVDYTSDTGHACRAAMLAADLGEYFTDRALAHIDNAELFRLWFGRAVLCWAIEQKLMTPINVNDVARR